MKFSNVNLSGAPARERVEKPLDSPKPLPSIWVFILVGILVLPLISLGFNVTRGSGEKSLAAAEESKPTTDMTDKIEELEPWVPLKTPGDFYSDIREAFEEGTSSGLVHLSTEEEERLFERMREVSRSESGMNLGFFRLDDGPDGIRVYEFRNGGAGEAQGTIIMDRLEERWRVVGVAPPPIPPSSETHPRDSERGAKP